MKGLKTKMNKIVNDNLRVGDKFKGNINKEIFEIMNSDKKIDSKINDNNKFCDSHNKLFINFHLMLTLYKNHLFTVFSNVKILLYQFLQLILIVLLLLLLTVYNSII